MEFMGANRSLRDDSTLSIPAYVLARQAAGETVLLTCNFIYLCSGYYSYVEGYTPVFPGAARFAGRRVAVVLSGGNIDESTLRRVLNGEL